MTNDVKFQVAPFFQNSSINSVHFTQKDRENRRRMSGFHCAVWCHRHRELVGLRRTHIQVLFSSFDAFIYIFALCSCLAGWLNDIKVILRGRSRKDALYILWCSCSSGGKIIKLSISFWLSRRETCRDSCVLCVREKYRRALDAWSEGFAVLEKHGRWMDDGRDSKKNYDYGGFRVWRTL